MKWAVARRRLEDLGCCHDPHLTLIRICLTMSELMRMVRSRLQGPLWFTAQEFWQAARAAPRAECDPRTTAFGEVIITKWLDLCVRIGVLVLDASAQRYFVVGYERTHRRAFEKALERHQRHNEANRLRYHIERDHSAPEDTREAEFGFLLEQGFTGKPGCQIANCSEQNASVGKSPNIYIQSASSNHEPEDEFIDPQPAADRPNVALGAAEPQRVEQPPRDAASREGCDGPPPDLPPDPERHAAFTLLQAGYGANAKSLGEMEDLEDWAVAEATSWRARHGDDPALARPLATRHRKRRLRETQEAQAAPPRSRPPAPTPLCDAPLRAKPLLALNADHAEHARLADRPGLPKRTRAHHQARLVAIETLIEALRAPEATPHALRQFWQKRRWLGTLEGAPASCRSASLELWAYVADRMEADGTCRSATNPAGLLIWRVGLWLAAQHQKEARLPCP